MKLTGVCIMVNYPEGEVEAAIPHEMTPAQLGAMLERLALTEPDMTSFTISAAVATEAANADS